jgi:hypothetical protein
VTTRESSWWKMTGASEYETEGVDSSTSLPPQARVKVLNGTGSAGLGDECEVKRLEWLI